MTYNDETAERLRVELREMPGITEKSMFGGVSFLLAGNMAIGVVGDDLCVRVGPEVFDDVVELPGARTMDFTGRPMKGWVFVSPVGYADQPSFEAWVKRGTLYAQRLPRK